MNLQTLQINDIEQLFFSNGRTSQKTSHEFTLRSHPTHIPMEGTPDVSPTAYEGIPFFVKILGKFGGIFPQFFFHLHPIWSDESSKQLSTMKMLEGQDGARHVKLGTSLIAPHVALVVPWRLGVLLSRCQKCPE